jgi:SAM-dependent methyltransferase
MEAHQLARWTEVLDTLAGVLPGSATCVVVDGGDGHPSLFADRLADTLLAAGRPCVRLTDVSSLADEDAWRADRSTHLVALADGSRWRARPPRGGWDVVIWLRTEPRGGHEQNGHPHDADIVIDLHDPAWPVIRHVDARLCEDQRWYVAESRAFFATRAASWDTRFGDDLPAYAAAVAEAGIPTGATVVDVGCGTGRALPALRDAIGPDGMVIGVDLTPEMLGVARATRASTRAGLLLADARRLPLATGAVAAVFAAGLVNHLPDVPAGLAELARVTRPGGRLAIFHPSGREALAARHGRVLRPDEPLAEGPLTTLLAGNGWRLDGYDDAPHRFLALARRVG